MRLTERDTGEPLNIGALEGRHAVVDLQATLESSSDVCQGDLEAFLGLGAGTLDMVDALSAGVCSGSATRQTVRVDAGEVLRFEYNFHTNEEPESFCNDFGFLSVSGGTGSALLLADTFSPLVRSEPEFRYETGFGSFRFAFPNTGACMVGFGVVNVGDDVVNSRLAIRGLRLGRALSSTPPSTAAPSKVGRAEFLGRGFRVARRSGCAGR